MSGKVYFPEAGIFDGDLYAMDNHLGRLWFTARLTGCGINLRFDGLPADFTFVLDEENKVDIVLKRYNWVAKFKNGSHSYWIVNGYFSKPEIGSEEIVYLDRDALVAGPNTPIAAAVYQISDGELIEGTYEADLLTDFTTAGIHTLLQV